MPVPGPRVPCLELGRAGRGRIAGSGRSSCQGFWPVGPAAAPRFHSGDGASRWALSCTGGASGRKATVSRFWKAWAAGVLLLC